MTSLRTGTKAKPAVLRLATYNIHKGVLREFFGLRHLSRIHELRSGLHELHADLVLLQEVQGKHERHADRFDHWPEERQDQFLAKSPALKRVFESAYGSNAHYLHGHHGNALLSRFPILREENRDVSDHAMEKRGVLHCVLKIEAQEVHVFVVHFGLFARSRARQLQAVLDWAKRVVPAGAPMIVGGDFNDWSNRLSQTLEKELGLVEVFEAHRPWLGRTQNLLDRLGERLNTRRLIIPTRIRTARTFPALLPWLRMDRLYLRGFEVRDVKVLAGPKWARLSDHSPLVADVVLHKR
jgi:endonuclease/exonuclease/phosphatase family metal-dependent hydrolase